MYPWGPVWEPARSNTSESGLSRTIAVGMYPHGASITDTEDMSGNIWEWCLNEYERVTNVQIEGTAPRAACGGSWINTHDLATVAACNYHGPFHRNYAWGFRVILSEEGHHI
jgi:formylglycine-generating enzyme required for sulfatase activity